MPEPVHYKVRTPLALWMGNGVLAALCLFVIASLVMTGDAPPILVVLALASFAAAAAFWLSTSPYRVGGGRNLIRFYTDRIEVPHVRERRPMVFARDGLHIAVRDVMVKVRIGFLPAGRISRGK